MALQQGHILLYSYFTYIASCQPNLPKDRHYKLRKMLFVHRVRGPQMFMFKEKTMSKEMDDFSKNGRGLRLSKVYVEVRGYP